MKPRTTFRLTLLAWAATTSLSALAQNGTNTSAATSAESLPTVVVTGARGERTLRETPSSIHLVNARTMEERQITNIRELADTMPNVEVDRSANRMSTDSTSGRAGNASFNIRGLDGNRVLMLVDGVRMPRTYSFGGSSRDHANIGLTERVELIKGPSSSLYGSDGIGGVVQFFTHTPETYLKNGKTFGGQVAVAYDGTDRSKHLGATVAGQANNTVQWLISANGAQGHALRTRGDQDTWGDTRTTANPQKFTNTALLGKVVITPNNQQKHTFTSEYVDRDDDLTLLSQYNYTPIVKISTPRGDMQYPLPTILTSEGALQNRRHRLSYQGEWQINTPVADTLRTTLAYQKLRTFEHYANTRLNRPSQVRDTLNHETLWQAGLQAERTFNLTPSVQNKLAYGVDFSQTKASTFDDGVTPPEGESFPLKRFPDTKERLLGVYVQNEIVGNGWSVIPGIRWDSYRISADQHGFGGTAVNAKGSAVSPRLAATVNLTPNWTAYGHYATGFRTPNADQVNRYLSSNIHHYKNIPNPNLKPERANHLELGFKGQGDNWKFDIAGFYGRYRNFILDEQLISGTVGNPRDPAIFQSINTDRATIKGFEVAGEYRFRDVLGGTLSIPAAFGMSKGKDHTTGKGINTIQPARLNLGLRYAQADWSVRLDATHRWAKKTSDVAPTAGRGQTTNPNPFIPPASTTLDLSAQWTLKRYAGGDIRLNAAIHNLTNKKYWRWNDVRGVAADSRAIDAYSQPGRSFSASLVARF